MVIITNSKIRFDKIVNMRRMVFKGVTIMNGSQPRALNFTNTVSAAAALLGFAVIVMSFFVSDLQSKYLLYSGIGVMVSSVFVYLFGLVLSLMEGAAHDSGQHHSNSKKRATPSH